MIIRDLPLSKLDLVKDSTAAPWPTVETLSGPLKGQPFFHQGTTFRGQKNWGWGLGAKGLGTSSAWPLAPRIQPRFLN